MMRKGEETGGCCFNVQSMFYWNFLQSLRNYPGVVWQIQDKPLFSILLTIVLNLKHFPFVIFPPISFELMNCEPTSKFLSVWSSSTPNLN